MFFQMTAGVPKTLEANHSQSGSMEEEKATSLSEGRSSKASLTSGYCCCTLEEAVQEAPLAAPEHALVLRLQALGRAGAHGGLHLVPERGDLLAQKGLGLDGAGLVLAHLADALLEHGPAVVGLLPDAGLDLGVLFLGLELVLRALALELSHQGLGRGAVARRRRLLLRSRLLFLQSGLKLDLEPRAPLRGTRSPPGGGGVCRRATTPPAPA